MATQRYCKKKTVALTYPNPAKTENPPKPEKAPARQQVTESQEPVHNTTSEKPSEPKEIPEPPQQTISQEAPSQDLQALTPSTLLQPGVMDLKIFNNLYTQTAFFNGDGDRTDVGSRQTYFTSIITGFYGITPKLNLGFDIFFKSVRFDAEDSSPFDVLQFVSEGNQTRTALASIAPKIKFTPFSGRLSGLALQQTFVFPLTNDLEGTAGGRPFLDYDDWQSWTQFFFDISISEKLLVYLEGGFFFRFDSNPGAPNHEITYPFKAIVNFYPTSRITLYGLTEFTPSTSANFNTYYTQLGVGGKFQVSPSFELETSATTFPIGLNKGAGVTYNLGFRVVR